MPTPSTLTPLPARTLPPGALDRACLASALTFVLSSVRAGSVQSVEARWWPGLDGEGLIWSQSDYVEDEVHDEDGRCGTACCVAGWIDLHDDGDGADDSIQDRALRRLVGFDADEADWSPLAGLPDGVDPWLVLRGLSVELDGLDETPPLFGGGNNFPDLLRSADALLALYGQGPLTVSPDGVFV